MRLRRDTEEKGEEEAMPMLKRVFASLAVRVHTSLFLFGAFVLVIVDLVQGVDSESTFLRLDWAHILVLVWMPILLFHALLHLWGGVMDDLDRETMRGLRGWFSS